jgi:hypothetical protein
VLLVAGSDDFLWELDERGFYDELWGFVSFAFNLSLDSFIWPISLDNNW